MPRTAENYILLSIPHLPIFVVTVDLAFNLLIIHLLAAYGEYYCKALSLA